MSSSTTKKAIAYAFKELLLEKPISKITVQDISELFEINRQTFYYHFQDIVDLVEWICIEDADKNLKEKGKFNSWQENFLSIFETIKKDKPFIINICRSVPLDILINYLYKLVYPLIYDVVNDKAKDKVVREEDKVFIANFYKYALVSEVLEWIKNDMKEDPQVIVNKISILLKGTIDQALNNLRKDNKF